MSIKILLSVITALLFQPVFAQSNSDSLKAIVEEIVVRDGYRTYKDTVTLNNVAEFIFDRFQQATDTTFYEVFTVNGVEYKNVVGRIGDKSLPTIVIGAHYDVFDDLPGADDNASGVAGMIEALRFLRGGKAGFCIEFVAYTLEEPPFFGSQAMGSFIHANNMHYDNRIVYGMISVEMIGYFSDEKGSQDYPLGLMKWFYGSKGDYILLTRKFFPGQFSRKIGKHFKRSEKIRTKKINAPTFIRGIDFSDHRNYWTFGYDAFMITDTSFYRNKNYHHASDTPETLDYERMAKVVDALIAAVTAL